MDFDFNISECFVKEWKNDKELYSYCQGFLKGMPIKKKGVYFIYEGDVLVYIGCSVNMLGRITDHLTRSSNSANFINNATRVTCKIIEDKDTREIYEYQQIKELNPTRNKMLPRLNKIQKELIKEDE